jgi:ribosomal protein S18 acetylase RimI-like enzyme
MRRIDDDTLAVLGHLNRIEFGRMLARWSGPAGRVIEQDGIVLFAAATAFPVLFNGVDRLDRGVPAAEVVAAADRFFGGLDRGYSMSLRDGHPDDLDLRAAAEAAGLVALTSSPEMVVDQPVEHRPPPDGVSLSWVDEGASVADFVEIADTAFVSLGMAPGAIRESFLAPDRIASPEVRTVVASVEGAPSAAAQVILSHGIAGVYCVGTLPSVRGRGLADLVTRAVTNRSFDEGARACTLQASPMGEAIYARMGYREIYRYSGLVRFEPVA